MCVTVNISRHGQYIKTAHSSNANVQCITKLSIKLRKLLNHIIMCNEGVEDCNFRCILICLCIIFIEDTAK